MPSTRRRRFRDADEQATIANEAIADAPDELPTRIGQHAKRDTATEKQLSFVNDLLAQVTLTDEQQAKVAQQLEQGLTRTQASAWIDRLLELRKAQPQQPRESATHVKFNDSVPAGRYAVTGDDGTTDFYKVDRPDEGRWAGYVFVKLLVAQGGHGIESLREQRLGMKQQATILDRIAEAGVEEASARFGRDIGHCGVCGRELTKDESIERGIGPVCAGRMGW